VRPRAGQTASIYDWGDRGDRSGDLPKVHGRDTESGFQQQVGVSLYGGTFVVNRAPPRRIIVVQWESLEKAQAFFEFDAYTQLTRSVINHQTFAPTMS
jgi:heme-degrading monooxygenase HmoA